MPAITGWFDHDLAPRNSAATPRLLHDQAADNTIVDGPAFWIQLKSSCCAVHIVDGTVTAVIGEPRDQDMQALTATDVACLAVKSSVGENGKPNWDQLRGRFAIVHINLAQSAATLVTDRFAVFPLCCLIEGSRIAFSDRADSVPASGSIAKSTCRRSSTTSTFTSSRRRALSFAEFSE